jgi:hypothetical protein
MHSAYNHKRATAANAVSHTSAERMQLLLCRSPITVV